MRFIPTSVGNTDRSYKLWRGASVHPHIRGEYDLVVVLEGRVIGSSPHPWGIHVSFFAIPSSLRFIPTSVGNTDCEDCLTIILAVHPHIRGEYVEVYQKEIVYERFIPTSVGNTVCSEFGKRFAPVHPHIRGEYLTMQSYWCNRHGSSPHPWGIRFHRHFDYNVFRFIPTSVGNTSPNVCTKE